MKRILVRLLLLLSFSSAWAQPPDIGPDLPESDRGLPGGGPLRREAWFREIWHRRRQEFAGSLQRDKGTVVFLGDSIIEFWGDKLASSFPGLRVANRGISGDTSRGVLLRLTQDVLVLHPRAVVLLVGTNDIEDRAEPAVTAKNLEAILEALQVSEPRMPVFLCAVFPSSASKGRPSQKIVALNNLYRKLTLRSPLVTYVDTWNLFADQQGDAKLEEFDDLVHPNQAGYSKWSRMLTPYLTRFR